MGRQLTFISLSYNMQVTAFLSYLLPMAALADQPTPYYQPAPAPSYPQAAPSVHLPVLSYRQSGPSYHEPLYRERANWIKNINKDVRKDDVFSEESMESMMSSEEMSSEEMSSEEMSSEEMSSE